VKAENQLSRRNCNSCLRACRCARSQRGQRIAQARTIGASLAIVTVGEVDEATVLVQMRKRVDKRALPRREKRGGED